MTTRLHLPSILFEVTPRCNLGCRYCYVPWEAPHPQLRAPVDDSFATAERTLNRLFDIARVDTVTMTGGEPLLQKRLPELVLRCRLAGSRVNIITNGTVGTTATYRSLFDLGVSLFELPLHARDPDVHDGLTARPGSWRKVVDSIGTLHDLGAAVVGVVVLTRHNAEVLADTLAFHRELGITRIMLNRFNPGGRGLVNADDLHLSIDDLRRAFDTIERTARELDLRVSSNVGLPHCLVDPRRYLRLRFASCTADLYRRPLALGLDGGLRFCNHSPIVFANIHRSSPDTLLTGPYLRQWREAVPAFCADCERFEGCFGGCRAAAEQIGGNLQDPDPLLAAIAAD